MTMHLNVAFAAVAVVACGKGEPEARNTSAKNEISDVPKSAASASTATAIAIPDGLSPDHRIAAEKGRDALLAACATTPLDWNEFKEVSLTTSTASGYLKDRFDWDLVVTVALLYKEGLDRSRGGHRLTFDMGAGNRPGIVTRKSFGIQLCGFTGRARGVTSDKPCDADGGEDCILDVPALKALDAARAPSVVESQTTAPIAWCFGHGFDPPQFWSCAPTEKACRRARTAEKREENGDYRVRTTCNKTETLHCFEDKNGRTVCAPDANACALSRNAWTDLVSAGPCAVATAPQLDASNKPVE